MFEVIESRPNPKMNYNIDSRLTEIAQEDIRHLIDSGKSGREFRQIVSALWYSRLPCYEVEGITGSFKGESSILKDCLWKGKKVTPSLPFPIHVTFQN